MSCIDAEKEISEPKIEKIISKEDKEINNGKPCIDFQPGDRWQIKEEDDSNESVPNLKLDMKCSNGRRSMRLRNSRSKDSCVNGDAEESSSDKDTNTEEVNKMHIESLDTAENKSSRRKRPRDNESDNSQDVENASEKKIKVEDDKDICDGENSTKNLSNCSKDLVDSDKAITQEPVEVPKKNGVDLDSSIEVLENEKQPSELEKNDEEEENEKSNVESSTKCLSPKEVPDKDCEIVENNKLKHKEKGSKNNDVEIEIININDDGKKSDDESDSEIQIINSDYVDPKFDVKDFPSTSSGELSLTAGYPYYNSLKEKISGFKAGDYKPVKFPHTGTLLLAENEVIIESPSLLVPLLIKESDEFPKLGGEVDKKTNEDSSPVIRPNMISKRNFFQSSVGQFLINLGTSRVQEWYHRDMKRAKLKQLKGNKTANEELEKTVDFHDKRHTELKEINAIFNFRLRLCKFCGFKSESLSVMEGHYLTPHLSPRREYKCNFCVFLTRDPDQIVFHYEAMHGKKAILDANIPFHECIFCSFQSHLKTKVNAHMNRCRKHFIPSQNLAPPFDFEFPGVTTKPVTIADVVGHRRLLLSSAKNRMPVPEDNSANSAYARKKLASVLNKLSGQSAYADGKNPSLMKQLMTTQSHLPPLSAGSSIQLPPGIVITRPRGSPIQQIRPMGRYPAPRGMQSIRIQAPRRGPPFTATLTSTVAASHLASSGISITPVTRASILPRPQVAGIRNVTLTPISTASNRTVSQKPGPPQPVALFTNLAGSTGLLGQPQARMPVNLRPLRPTSPYQRLNTPPSQVVKGSSGNTFVVCEICDSYIKDLEELRTHMNFVHKVKIHPKMLVSRPPLNCQKCQWRFFTDQGLERHLLGAHGLVTTNMQEMANKNQDGGRCIICGAVFTYKLVSHMTQVHKVTLKPAHLSYKCTVCTATFTLYRLFESHVYNVHSGSAKRPADDSPSEPPAKKVAEEPGPRRCKDCNIVTENMHEHLIKHHIKKCYVKCCRIEKCKKCLYSSDEMLLIRMSDFGLDDLDDSGDDSDSEEGSSEQDDDDDSSEDKQKETG